VDFLTTYLSSLFDTVVNPAVRYSSIYLICTLVLARILWIMRGRPESFIAWMLPRRIYAHRSNLVDIKLFLVNHFLSFVGLFGALFFAPLVAFAMLELFNGEVPDFETLPRATLAANLLTTLVVVMTTDFCNYWSHRISHDWKWLWPFHAVHHSATVLTPLTVSRAHPVELIIRKLVSSVLVGAVQAVTLYMIMGQVSLVMIGGANVVYVIFNALGSNFRHSHIWVSYGRVLEHIFISPAQHQIHHSSAREHHDKNYGSIFALWDWAFGTLYVPQRQEELTFGVTDAKGKLMETPHDTLRDMLLTPFVDSWKALCRKLGLRRRAGKDDHPPAIPQQMSLWLDALRAGAALTVVFGHMAHLRFTGGDYYLLREINIASDAVVVFFVLSGLVIAYAAERDGTAERFAFNRLTRVLSVLLPALALTWVFDSIGTRADLSAYPRTYYGDLPLGTFLLRGLTVSGEWLGLMSPVRLGTNGPIWSLSYEVAFYAMFGAWVFLQGRLRLAVLALMTAIFGLPILVMLPAWLLGVLVWRICCGTLALPRAGAWMLAVMPVAALVLAKAIGLDAGLGTLTAEVLSPINPKLLLRFSDEVLWNTVIAGGVALHLVGVWQLSRARDPAVEGRIASAVRWVAGASFSIYLVHYPTLHLLDALLPETLPFYHLILLTVTLGLSLVFAALFERPLKRFRAGAQPLWDGAKRALHRGKVYPAE